MTLHLYVYMYVTLHMYMIPYMYMYMTLYMVHLYLARGCDEVIGYFLVCYSARFGEVCSSLSHLRGMSFKHTDTTGELFLTTRSI